MMKVMMMTITVIHDHDDDHDYDTNEKSLLAGFLIFISLRPPIHTLPLRGAESALWAVGAASGPGAWRPAGI